MLLVLVTYDVVIKATHVQKSYMRVRMVKKNNFYEYITLDTAMEV